MKLESCSLLCSHRGDNERTRLGHDASVDGRGRPAPQASAATEGTLTGLWVCLEHDSRLRAQREGVSFGTHVIVYRFAEFQLYKSHSKTNTDDIFERVDPTWRGWGVGIGGVLVQVRGHRLRSTFDSLGLVRLEGEESVGLKYYRSRRSRARKSNRSPPVSHASHVPPR